MDASIYSSFGLLNFQSEYFNISHNIISQHISIYLNIVNIYTYIHIYIHINVLIYNRHEHVQCKYIDAEKLENIGESS